MMRSRRGGILLYILGMIALLSIVVTEFLIGVAGTIRYRSQVAHREDLRILAYSVLETTIAVLAEIKAVDKGLFSPVQGWDDPLSYAKFVIPKGYTVSVNVKDETGKLSIYQEDSKTFGDLMQEMGISFEYIANLKSELKAWLAKPKENVINSKSKSPEKPKDPNSKDKKKQRFIYNFIQLKDLPTFEKIFFVGNKSSIEKFKLLKDSVSIIHNDLLNINTAPDIIKKMILGNLSLSSSTEGKAFFRKMADLGIEGNAAKELEKVIGFNATVLNIDIQVARGTVKYYLSAVIDVEADSVNAENKGDFKFLALTEDSIFDR